jgi:hypothetical protein
MQVKDEILPVSPSERFEETTNDHLSGLRLAHTRPAHLPTPPTRTASPCTRAFYRTLLKLVALRARP